MTELERTVQFSRRYNETVYMHVVCLTTFSQKHRRANLKAPIPQVYYITSTLGKWLLASRLQVSSGLEQEVPHPHTATVNDFFPPNPSHVTPGPHQL